MKKILLILIIVILCFSIVGCGFINFPDIDFGGDDGGNSGGDSGSGNSGGGNSGGSSGGDNSGGGNSGGNSGSGSSGGGNSGDSGSGSHSHSFSTEYYYDQTYHWFQCDCGSKQSTYKHTWANSTVNGCKTIYTCSKCPATKTVENAHVWNTSGVYSAQTVSTTYSCVSCNATNVISGLPNNEINETISGTVPDATAEEAGYFSYKLSLSRSNASDDSNGKLIIRNSIKTYIEPIFVNNGDTSIIPPDTAPMTYVDLKYVGTLLPKEIYELAYSFTDTPGTVELTPYLIHNLAVEHADTFRARMFNIIRFIYYTTDRDVLLSFEFDTSMIYQYKGLVVRAKITVDECASDVAFNTIEDVFKQIVVPDNENPFNSLDALELYNANFGTFNVNFLTDETESSKLQSGDSVWCDIHVGIPVMSGTKDDATWKMFLANSPNGKEMGFQLY